MRLERLTYVHDGDPGAIGLLLSEARWVVLFGVEGSGLLELDRSPSAPPPAHGSAGHEHVVRVTAVKFSALPNDVQAELGDAQVPCLLGHAGVHSVVLLPPRSLARVTGGLSDLRGKLKFGLARVGWEL